MRPVVLMISLLVLAACGIDGAPTAPTADPGVSISGTAKVGVVVN